MNHFATPHFWHCYRQLPKEVQRKADKNYQLMAENLYHPSLHFKSIRDELWSVRVGLGYRALATIEEGDYVWFRIGTHAQYDRLIN